MGIERHIRLLTSNCDDMTVAPAVAADTPETEAGNTQLDDFSFFQNSTISAALLYTSATARIVSGMAIGLHNLSDNGATSCSYRIICYSDVAQTTEVYNSGLQVIYPKLQGADYDADLNGADDTYFNQNSLISVTGQPGYSASTEHVVTHFFDEVSVKAIVIIITNYQNNPNVGRIILGRTFIPQTTNIDFGANVETIDQTEHIELADGGIYSLWGRQRRRASLPISELSQADRDLFNRLIAPTNKTKWLVVATDPEETEYCKIRNTFMGRQSVDPAVTSKGRGKSSLRLVIDEI